MISIIIPTYEMAGQSVEMLNDLLDSIQSQEYTDIEIIVTDDSRNDKIDYYCYNHPLDIIYTLNPGNKGCAYNFNHGLTLAKGEIIKPMFQDDQFLDTDCLTRIANMKGDWAVCDSAHIGGRGVHIPYPELDIMELAKGRNTYGSPSAVAWRRNDMAFDESLVWLFDCDFYARMILKYGQPEFIRTQVLIREWEGSVTNTIGRGQIRVTEYDYIVNKFTPLMKP